MNSSTILKFVFVVSMFVRMKRSNGLWDFDGYNESANHTIETQMEEWCVMDNGRFNLRVFDSFLSNHNSESNSLDWPTQLILRWIKMKLVNCRLNGSHLLLREFRKTNRTKFLVSLFYRFMNWNSSRIEWNIISFVLFLIRTSTTRTRIVASRYDCGILWSNKRSRTQHKIIKCYYCIADHDDEQRKIESYLLVGHRLHLQSANDIVFATHYVIPFVCVWL